MQPRWQWRLEDEPGTALDRPTSPVFEARFDAEQWLGEHWRTLAAQGVCRAVLRHEGVPVPPAIPIPRVDPPPAA